MKANGSSTGEIYSSYKNLCKVVGKDGLTQRRVTQMLSEIELIWNYLWKINPSRNSWKNKKIQINSFFRNDKKIFQKRINFARYSLNFNNENILNHK